MSFSFFPSSKSYTKRGYCAVTAGGRSINWAGYVNDVKRDENSNPFSVL